MASPQSTAMGSPSASFSLTSSSLVPASNDLPAQMMYMMVESFSKLSAVLVENRQESKVDWPKFSGDSKKFRDWYLAVMTQVSLPPWSTLYDPTRNDIISTTTNNTLFITHTIIVSITIKLVCKSYNNITLLHYNTTDNNTIIT